MKAQSKSTVVEFPRKRTRYAGLELVPGLQNELLDHIRKGVTLKSMSEKCNGKPGVTTISRLAYGLTKEPRFSTVVTLYVMLGFTIVAER
jgi:hypothetical protein